MMTFVPSDGVVRSPGVETSLTPAISAGETWSDLENKRRWNARNAWTTPPVKRAGLQVPEPGSRPNELLALSENVYNFHNERIMEACGGVIFGLVSLAVVVAHAPFVWSLIHTVFFAVGALWLLWRSLRNPYELQFAPSGLLRFTSVSGSTELRAADIVRLVRRERVSNGSLHVIRVEHSAGSITLDGHEDVFARLANLVPAAQVSKEKYDDTD